MALLNAQVYVHICVYICMYVHICMYIYVYIFLELHRTLAETALLFA